MKYRALIFVLIWLYFSNLYAAFENLETALVLGNANATVASCKGVEAFFSNLAGLSKTRGYNIYYEENDRYGFDEMSQTNFAAAFDMAEFGKWGFFYSRFGFDLYKEEKSGIGVGTEFGKFRMGFAGYKLRLKVEEKYVDAFSFDAGFMYSPYEKLSFGLSFKNFNSPKLLDKVDRVTTLGVSYTFQNFTLELDWENSDYNRFRVGYSWKINDWFTIKSGYLSKPSSFTGGFKLVRSRFIVDFAFTTHTELGTTSYLGFGVQM